MRELQDALTSAARAQEELRSVGEDIARGIAFDPRTITRRALPPRDEEYEDRPPPKPTLTPDEVLDGWRRGGLAWFQTLGARDQTAVSRAYEDPTVAGALARDEGFITQIMPRLPLRRRARLLAGLVVAADPLPSWLWAAARDAYEHDVRAPWLQVLIDGPEHNALERLASRVATAIIEGGWRGACSSLTLTSNAAQAPFATRVIATATVTTLDGAMHLRDYPDRGEQFGASAPLGAAHHAAVRALVAYAEREDQRRNIAVWLRERVGEVFGDTARDRWAWDPQLRDLVRSWVAGEVLGIVFNEIAPDRHILQTLDRKVFWSRYTYRLERLWLFLPVAFRDRAQRDEITRLMSTEALQIGELEEGQEHQALLWMHLRGNAGPVTVIEGNANTTCRGWIGAHRPRGKRVRYASIMSDQYDLHQKHGGNWQEPLAEKLRALGVHPSNLVSP
jgi:hypothetical protein